jgi:thiamine-monophosphate kinase
MTVSELTEAELIARIRSHLPPPPDWVTVGIGDDAAVVEPARNRIEVLTVDALVEGIHFDRGFTPPAAIGHRALAVNLSDLAAMGAEPRLALLSLALPAALCCGDFDAMVGGLAALASRHRMHIVGGNLTRSPGPLVVDVTVSGAVKRRRALTRAGARAGDVVYVTGSIGGAAAGLQMLKGGTTEGKQPIGKTRNVDDGCVGRYLHPEPRVRSGMLLSRNRAATACMDLSDGLADAVTQVAAASGVGIVVDAAALPIDPGAREWFAARGLNAVGEAVAGGDDYELLFTARPQWARRVEAVARDGGVTITKIGVCTVEPAVTIRRTSGEEPMPRGFSHFA